MNRPELPLDGGCRCGRVRLRITEAPMLTAACHCRGCQQMSASAFSLSIGVPTHGFAVTQGEPVIGGLHGAQQHHFHCEHCKAWLFTRMEPDVGFVNVRASALDDHAWYEPFIETQTAEKLAWATTPARHSFERFPPMASYGSLLAEFAALWSK